MCSKVQQNLANQLRPLRVKVEVQLAPRPRAYLSAPLRLSSTPISKPFWLRSLCRRSSFALRAHSLYVLAINTAHELQPALRVLYSCLHTYVSRAYIQPLSFSALCAIVFATIRGARVLEPNHRVRPAAAKQKNGQ